MNSNTDGAGVTVQNCNINNGILGSEWWHVEQRTSSAYRLMVPGTGKCLDVPNGNGGDGTKMQVWSCFDGNTNQLWELRDDNTIRWASNPNLYVLPISPLGTIIPIVLNTRWSTESSYKVSWLKGRSSWLGGTFHELFYKCPLSRRSHRCNSGRVSQHPITLITRSGLFSISNKGIIVQRGFESRHRIQNPLVWFGMSLHEPVYLFLTSDMNLFDSNCIYIEVNLILKVPLRRNISFRSGWAHFRPSTMCH
jgi:hypothetical protein